MIGCINEEILFPFFPCSFKFLYMLSINEADQLHEIKHSGWELTYLTKEK